MKPLDKKEFKELGAYLLLSDNTELQGLVERLTWMGVSQAIALKEANARVEKLQEALKFVENHIHPDTPKSHIKTYKEAAYKVAKHASQDKHE